jgi:hypothetical protein
VTTGLVGPSDRSLSEPRSLAPPVMSSARWSSLLSLTAPRAVAVLVISAMVITNPIAAMGSRSASAASVASTGFASANSMTRLARLSGAAHPSFTLSLGGTRPVSRTKPGDEGIEVT